MNICSCYKKSNKGEPKVRCSNHKMKGSNFCYPHRNCSDAVFVQVKVEVPEDQQHQDVKPEICDAISKFGKYCVYDKLPGSKFCKAHHGQTGVWPYVKGQITPQQVLQLQKQKPSTAPQVVDLTQSPAEFPPGQFAGPTGQDQDLVPIHSMSKIAQTSPLCDAIKKDGSPCTHPKTVGRFCGVHAKGKWPYIKGEITPKQVVEAQKGVKKDAYSLIMQKAGQLLPAQRAYLSAKCGVACCPLVQRQHDDSCKYGICNPPSPQLLTNPQAYPAHCKRNCDKIVGKIVRKNSVAKKDPKRTQKTQYYQYLQKYLKDAYDEANCGKSRSKKVTIKIEQ